MTPDDSRHGSHAGAVQHWKDGERACERCLRASRRADKLRRITGRGVLVPARGTTRRLRALQALGWSLPQIAAHTDGLTVRTITNPLYRSESVMPQVASGVARAYDALSMTVPTGPYAHRSRLAAQRKGWAVPLAWDDIDDDDAPRGARPTPRRRQIDPVVVDRILAGQVIACTTAERRAALAAWTARGGSERSLCLAQGWKPGRYTEKEAVA